MHRTMMQGERKDERPDPGSEKRHLPDHALSMSRAPFYAAGLSMLLVRAERVLQRGAQRQRVNSKVRIAICGLSILCSRAYAACSARDGRLDLSISMVLPAVHGQAMRSLEYGSELALRIRCACDEEPPP